MTPARRLQLALALLALLVLCWPAAAAAEGLEVHEWGTFTCLQDEQGQAIGGINVEDEPLPAFAHTLARFLLVHAFDENPPAMYQGAPRCHPDVTMRLETPVTYFHLPAGVGPLRLDVVARFCGGWFTEYYPDAQTTAPGVEGVFQFGPIRPSTTGTLSWKGLTVGVEGSGPAAREHVWTAPRAVRAANVQATNGETERFLFYRGVGAIGAPLRVVRRGHQFEALAQASSLTLPEAWFARIGTDGSTTFRKFGPLRLESPGQVLARWDAALRGQPARRDAAELRSSMARAARRAGLHQDEAEALLSTWELSYFRSPGERLFFLLPQGWTEKTMPLEVSVSCQMTRVMVGRIELVTPRHRKFLQALARAPVPEQPWRHVVIPPPGEAPPPQGFRFEGAMPPAYRQLGRFRNALVLDELRRRPTPALKAFVEVNGLRPFEPVDHRQDGRFQEERTYGRDPGRKRG